MPLKPPKWTRTLSRNPKGGHRKRTTYDYATASSAMVQPVPTASITTHAKQNAPEPLPPKSPLKKLYKTMLQDEQSKVGRLNVMNSLLQKNMEAKDKNDSVLKDKRQLSALLQEAREKSRLTITKLLNKVEWVIVEANNIKFNAKPMVASAVDGVQVDAVEIVWQEQRMAEISLIKRKEKNQADLLKNRQYFAVRRCHVSKNVFKTSFKSYF